MAIIREDLLKEFAFWSSILILKVLFMAIFTAYHRFRNKIFANPEDYLLDKKSMKLKYDDPDVERVRRAHLNDLENILPWCAMTLVWLTTGPSYYLAMILIRTFVVARILHTIVYAVFAVQPHRVLAFAVGYVITIYEAVSTMMYYA